jgi:hypothetical protein
MTAPLISSDVDLRDFDYMPFYGKRLFASETWILCDDAEKVAALRLWWASWHEEPAGSLPDNDRLLADLAGYGVAVKAFQVVRANAMRGWIKCDDGRLYHPIVCEIAEEVWGNKRKKREDNERDRARKARKRGHVPADAKPETKKRPAEAKPVPPENTAMSGGQDGKSGNLSGGIPAENALKGREGKEKGNNIQSDTTTQPYQAPARAIPPTAAAPINFPGKHALFEAVRAKVEAILNSPTCTNLGRIDAWLKAGAVPERDIYPTLDRMKAKWSGSSLKFFDGGISDAIAAASAPLPEPRRAAPSDGQFEMHRVDSPEADRALLEVKATILKAGNRYDDTTQGDVDAMLAAELVTAEQAQRMGYRA